MKIKNVSIQAFKSYLLPENGFFNFEIENVIGEKEVADFISLYAPNGFGKTSFYDAVDFAITNNVSRYIRGNKAKNNAYQNLISGSRYVLRNNEADNYESKNDIPLPTKLKVVTTKNTYNNSVKKPKGKQKSDYLSNKTNPQNVQTPKTEYMNRVLLSQEAIDAFLRESNPQDRFEEFIKNSDSRLSEYFEQRETIRKQCKVIEKAISGIESSIAIKKQEMNELGELQSPFDDVNEIVDTLNSLGLNKIRRFFNPFSQNDYEILTSEILVFKEKLKDYIDSKIILKIEKLEDFLNNKDVVSGYFKEVNYIVEKLKEVKVILSKVDDKVQVEKAIKDIVPSLKAKQEEINFNVKAFAQIEPYLIATNKLFSLKSLCVQLKDEIKSKKQDKNLAESRHSEVIKKSISVENNLTRTLNVINEIPGYFNEIHKLEASLSTYSSTRKDIVDGITKNKEKLSQAKLNVSTLKSFSIKKIIHLKEEWTHEVSEVAKSLNLLYADSISVSDKINLKASQLKELESKLKKSEMHSQSVFKLVNEASEIINQSKQESCPVCNHQYKSFEDLKSSILSNEAFSDYQKILSKSIDTVFYDVSILNELFINKEKVYVSTLDKVIEAEELIVSKLEESIRLDNYFLEDRDSLIKLTSDRLNELREKTEFSSEDELKESLDLKLEKFNSKKLEHDKEKKKLTDLIKILEHDLSSLENNLENKIHLIQVHEGNKLRCEELSQLISMQEISVAVDEQKLISVDNKKLEGIIKDLISTAEKNKDLMFENQKLLKDKFETLEKQYPETSDSVKENLEYYRDRLASTRKHFAKYLEVFEAFSVELPDTQEGLEEINKELAEELSKLILEKEKYDSHLNSSLILEKLACRALEYSKSESLKAELYSLENMLNKRKALSVPLEGDLENINKFIQNKANEFFNTPLINKLYESIEPHPDFREIHFECTLSEKSRGELNIFAYNPSDEQKLSPNLSFSSAQINVLSLSVFLARALTTKDDDGNNVDCIFIDDPIQSMDSINVLSLIDLIRNIITNFGKQVIISTHDENFHELLKSKIPTDHFRSKYMRLESFGKVVEDWI